jgi:hypothetical protein
MKDEFAEQQPLTKAELAALLAGVGRSIRSWSDEEVAELFGFSDEGSEFSQRRQKPWKNC